MKHNYKTAIITYPNANNLGDYIQKIASKQFLNEDIIEIDRDNLNNYSGEKIKLILNGWFMEKPKNWPPSDNIIPFFIIPLFFIFISIIMFVFTNPFLHFYP